MTFELTDTRTAVFSDEDRRWLYDHREPPPGTRVWLGTMDGDSRSWHIRARHHGFKLGLIEDIGIENGPTSYMQSTALGLKGGFFLVTSADGFDLNFQLGQLAPKLRQIWPTVGPFSFPFAYRLNDDEAELASNVILSVLDQLGYPLGGS